MKAVSSTIHQKLKYVCSEGIVTVRGSQSTARECVGGAISLTLTEKRPKSIADVTTQVAEATKHNHNLLISGERSSDSPKCKSTEASGSSSSKHKIEA